ncbi:MAG: helix-turn-helix transcriptional regulator [Clostridia bacterium]|nr:helix-turn-helix transcriptional regulator [Clostridia bacterium]
MECKKINSFGYYYPTDKESQLINLVKSGNRDKVKKLVDEIFDVNFNEYLLSPSMFTLFKTDISCTLVKILFNLIKESSTKSINDFITIEKITSCQDKEQLRKITHNMIDDILQNADKITQNHLVAEIVDYVEKNYIIPDLSVSVIAEHFNVHISYLSTTFKKQMSMGLAEYIQTVRISQAKYLLKNTNKKVLEIANEVGYFSLHTFVRVFKNSEGVTPAKYRHI